MERKTKMKDSFEKNNDLINTKESIVDNAKKILEETIKILYEKKEDVETSCCKDIVVWQGPMNEFKDGNWIKYKDRKKNEKKIKISVGKKNEITIVIILESPHIKEYEDNDIQPAKGITGDNLHKYFDEVIGNVIFKEMNAQQKIRVILMNSIQYQCSLGIKTSVYRDEMFIRLWFNCGHDKLFLDRLKKYKPDFIVNLCTKGKIKKELKSKVILNPDIKKQDQILNRSLTLQEIVSWKIGEYIQHKQNIKYFEGNHPSSWSRKTNNRKPIVLKSFSREEGGETF